MNIYKSIVDWLKDVCPFSDWVYFNVIRMEIGTNTVSTVSGDSKTEQYIDGSSMHDLPFAISLVRQYSAEQSSDNINVMEEIEQIVDEIESELTLPDLGTNARCMGFEIIQDTPSVNIYQDANACEYQIQAKITYLKKARITNE